MMSKEVAHPWLTPVRSARISIKRVAYEEVEGAGLVLSIELLENREGEGPTGHCFSFPYCLLFRSVDESYALFDEAEEQERSVLPSPGPLQVVYPSRLVAQFQSRFPWIEDYLGKLTHYRVDDGGTVVDIVTGNLPCFSTLGEKAVVGISEESHQMKAAAVPLGRRVLVGALLGGLKVAEYMVIRPLMKVLGAIHRSAERDINKAIHAMLHEVTREVPYQELPRRLASEVDRHRSTLEELAFTRLGSTEAKRLHLGGVDSYSDLWISGDRQVLVEFSLQRQARFVLFTSLPRWLFPVETLTVSIETRLSSEKFLVTPSVMAPGALPEENFLVNEVTAETGLTERVRAHLGALEAHIQRTGERPLPIESMESIFAKEKLQSQILYAHSTKEAERRAKDSPFPFQVEPHTTGIHATITNFFSLVCFPGEFAALEGATPTQVVTLVSQVLSSEARAEQLSALFFVREACKRAPQADTLRKAFATSEFKQRITALLSVPHHGVYREALELLVELFQADGAQEIQRNIQVIAETSPFVIPHALSAIHSQGASVKEHAERLLKSDDFLQRWAVTQLLDDHSLVWRDWHVPLLDGVLTDSHPLVRVHAERIAQERASGIQTKLDPAVVSFDDVYIWFENMKSEAGKKDHAREEILSFIDRDLPRLRDERCRYQLENPVA